jgi:uncharacterized FAD-dependent dehydrogenase
MQIQFNLRLLPSEVAYESSIKESIAAVAGIRISELTGYTILKRSIDARGKQAWISMTVNAFINEPFVQRELMQFHFGELRNSNRTAIIIGSGPAGLFAALKLIEHRIRPIILERGKEVRARRRDLATLNKDGILNPESNYCFGEGGAGTYSDGKLYTRSTKRGNVNRILNLLVKFGAAENILYETHPHIGTNKLPHIITAIRKTITDCGGEFLFEKKVNSFMLKSGLIKGVKTGDGDSFEADAFILATGHSARDIFQLLHQNEVLVEPKPFALGVRIEHPQILIDQIQYHCNPSLHINCDPYLPPASYSLVQQAEGRGTFSFCMCPGGIIAPASTNQGELVVNGWSPSKRNNPYANSGIVVTVEEKDFKSFEAYGPLAGLHFQQSVEQKAFQAGGGKFVAPAQRMVDFVNGKISASLPDCSYLPGIHSASLEEVLPPFVYRALREGFKSFGKKMRGYYTNEAVVLATESRSSSPVKIPREAEALHHPQIRNLYPCGEGAGYAGGIVSAAMDGEKVAEALALNMLKG